MRDDRLGPHIGISDADSFMHDNKISYFKVMRGQKFDYGTLLTMCDDDIVNLAQSLIFVHELRTTAERHFRNSAKIENLPNYDQIRVEDGDIVKSDGSIIATSIGTLVWFGVYFQFPNFTSRWTKIPSDSDLGQICADINYIDEIVNVMPAMKSARN